MKISPNKMKSPNSEIARKSTESFDFAFSSQTQSERLCPSSQRDLTNYLIVNFSSPYRERKPLGEVFFFGGTAAITLPLAAVHFVSPKF
ncbi:MAG: hypothetical protein N3A61_07385 [Ignavibacteria bacterium]|nr:hypothetical protein [Ignavibacteria bacterium]